MITLMLLVETPDEHSSVQLIYNDNFRGCKKPLKLKQEKAVNPLIHSFSTFRNGYCKLSYRFQYLVGVCFCFYFFYDRVYHAFFINDKGCPVNALVLFPHK